MAFDWTGRARRLFLDLCFIHSDIGQAPASGASNTLRCLTIPRNIMVRSIGNVRCIQMS